VCVFGTSHEGDSIIGRSNKQQEKARIIHPKTLSKVNSKWKELPRNIKKKVVRKKRDEKARKPLFKPLYKPGSRL